MSFPCSWALHPGLSATRSNGKAVLAGKAWTRQRGVPVEGDAHDRRQADRRPFALDGEGRRSPTPGVRPPGGTSWSRASKCRGGAELFEASLVLR